MPGPSRPDPADDRGYVVPDLRWSWRQFAFVEREPFLIALNLHETKSGGPPRPDPSRDPGVRLPGI
jgi:hypothetical protein